MKDEGLAEAPSTEFRIERDEEEDDDEEDDVRSRKSALLGREVPLVELKLSNVTYAPMTTTANTKGNGSKSEKQRTTVLRDVTTTIAPYTLTSWMGPSGSGKTSLISVAADLIKHGDLQSGTITVNGERGRIPKRLVGVVWQDDLLLSNLTVEENIFFAARLKTPESTPDSQVRQLVEETMADLGLTHIRNSLVGSPLSAAIRGVSGGERKRVSVAAELVVRPSLLLVSHGNRRGTDDCSYTDTI